MVKIYVDNGISGTKEFNRSGFVNMIKDGINNKYDFIVESPSTSKLYKVQVKTTERISNGVAVFTCRSTGLRKNKQWVHVSYTSQDCDMMYLYCIEKDWSGIICSKDFPKCNFQIRFENPLHPNKNINRPEDYSFKSVIQGL